MSELTQTAPAIDMADRVCLVTGASGALGKATALGLARRGAIVMLAYRNKARGEADRAEIEAASGNANVLRMLVDMASHQSVREMATNFKGKHNKLDVMSNNASAF